MQLKGDIVKIEVYVIIKNIKEYIHQLDEPSTRQIRKNMENN